MPSRQIRWSVCTYIKRYRAYTSPSLETNSSLGTIILSIELIEHLFTMWTITRVNHHYIHFRQIITLSLTKSNTQSYLPCWIWTLHWPRGLPSMNTRRNVGNRKKHIQSLLTENRHLKEELLKNQDEVRSLQNGLNGIMNYCGRNASTNRKKMKWDQADHCNNNIIREFGKNKL